MKDKRKLPRYITNLRVSSQAGNELLGYCANLHLHGMMLVTKVFIEIGTVLDVWLEDPISTDLADRIPLTVRCLWNRYDDADPGLYDIGMRYVDPSQWVLRHIRSHINDLNGRQHSPGVCPIDGEEYAG